jgi:hypothetical protein
MQIKINIPGVCNKKYNTKEDIVDVEKVGDILLDNRKDLEKIYEYKFSPIAMTPKDQYIRSDGIIYSIKGYTYKKNDKGEWERYEI